VDGADPKEETFRKIKKSREALVHGNKVDERQFPIDETQALLRAFLEKVS
jgi:hypothetical protein